MTAFPTVFSDTMRVLTDEVVGEAGKRALATLSGKGYEVYVGLTPKYASLIKQVSLQPSIREYCPKDCTTRFGDQETTAKWLAKGRSMFLLIKKSDNGNEHLAGYGWCGPEASDHIPSGETTFAPRISETDQGLGLAAPFSQAVIEATAVIYSAKNFWLKTWASNGGAVHIYRKMGFVDVNEEPGQRTTTSGATVDDVRIYMSYPNELLPTDR